VFSVTFWVSGATSGLASFALLGWHFPPPAGLKAVTRTRWGISRGTPQAPKPCARWRPVAPSQPTICPNWPGIFALRANYFLPVGKNFTGHSCCLSCHPEARPLGRRIGIGFSRKGKGRSFGPLKCAFLRMTWRGSGRREFTVPTYAVAETPRQN